MSPVVTRGGAGRAFVHANVAVAATHAPAKTATAPVTAIFIAVAVIGMAVQGAGRCPHLDQDFFVRFQGFPRRLQQHVGVANGHLHIDRGLADLFLFGEVLDLAVEPHQLHLQGDDHFGNGDEVVDKGSRRSRQKFRARALRPLHPRDEGVAAVEGLDFLLLPLQHISKLLCRGPGNFQVRCVPFRGARHQGAAGRVLPVAGIDARQTVLSPGRNEVNALDRADDVQLFAGSFVARVAFGLLVRENGNAQNLVRPEPGLEVHPLVKARVAVGVVDDDLFP
jgi:hypothetical protein